MGLRLSLRYGDQDYVTSCSGRVYAPGQGRFPFYLRLNNAASISALQRFHVLLS